LADWITNLINLGYIGVFLLSFIGALSIFIPIPYTFSYYILGAKMDPLLLAIAGGSGSAFGEISGYALGYFGSALISDKQKLKMEYVMKIFNHYGPIVIFLFALTPLPDDLLFIPLGILRYNFLKLFIPCLLGKVAMTFAISYSGRISFEFINTLFGEAKELSVIFMIVISMILLIAMFKIDWEKLFNKYFNKNNNLFPP
jgi:membrane protein YqaA with SNARE-associated domain